MIQLTIETITPEMATYYLSLSKGNRKVQKQRIKHWAAEMSGNRWLLTGEAIKFNGTALVDGHHRLMACIEADTPFVTAVARGIEGEAYDVMDSGLPRSAADAVHAHGITDANNTASTARLYLHLRDGKIIDAATAPSRHQVVEFVTNNTERAVRATQLGRSVRDAMPTTISTSGAAFMLFEDRSDHEFVTEFYRSVIDGIELVAGSPQLALRNWLTSTRTTGTYNPRGRIVSAHIRAWNAYVTYTPLSLIRPWFVGQPYPEILSPKSTGSHDPQPR